MLPFLRPAAAASNRTSEGSVRLDRRPKGRTCIQPTSEAQRALLDQPTLDLGLVPRCSSKPNQRYRRAAMSPLNSSLSDHLVASAYRLSLRTVTRRPTVARNRSGLLTQRSR